MKDPQRCCVNCRQKVRVAASITAMLKSLNSYLSEEQAKREEVYDICDGIIIILQHLYARPCTV